jgi:stearoyl-CoA desaturase (Delta-9 desaturase)
MCEFMLDQAACGLVRDRACAVPRAAHAPSERQIEGDRVTEAPGAGMTGRVTRLERNANIAAVVIPFLGVLVAAVLLWNRFLGPRDLAIFAVMYLLSALGITVGFHRLLTHRAFQTHRWLRYTLAILGSLSLQGGVIDWVADHRKHHAFTDEEGDPHSPHAGHGAGLRGMVAGLWHAHVGWLFQTHGQASSKRFAADLVEDPTMRRINRSFPLIALGSLVLPFLAGFALSGGSLVDGGLSALLWAGLVRIFLVHHITWSINSICHFFGSRRFDTDDHSTPDVYGRRVRVVLRTALLAPVTTACVACSSGVGACQGRPCGAACGGA